MDNDEVLYRLLRNVWSDPTTSTEIKVATSLEILKNVDIQQRMEITKRELTNRRNEFDQFLFKHYNPYYWDAEDVARWSRANRKLKETFSDMDTHLDKVMRSLEYLSGEKKKLSHEIEQLFSRLEARGYKFKTPTREEALQDFLAAFEKYVATHKELKAPLNEMNAVLHEVVGAEETTRKFGVAVTGLSLTFTGLWLGAVLELGIAGSAVFGGARSGVETIVDSATSGEDLSKTELILSIIFGAALNAAQVKYVKSADSVLPDNSLGVAGQNIAEHVIKIGDATKKQSTRLIRGLKPKKVKLDKIGEFQEKQEDLVGDDDE